MNIPNPPRNSQIQVKSEVEGVTLFWKKPSGGVFRYLIAAFLVFWLCGWCVALVGAGRQLLANADSVAFLAFWLAGWTVGGVFAGTALYLLLRPQKPESVRLEGARFKYDTGCCFPGIFLNPYWMMRKAQCPVNPFSAILQKRKTYEFARSLCPEFVLEGVGDDQRLRFDDGADRIAIGETLKEPEREWLAEVLNSWRSG